MRRLSSINIANHGVARSAALNKSQSFSGDRAVGAELVFSRNNVGVEVSSSPVNNFLAQNLSQASADFVFKIPSDNDKSTGVNTDSISVANARAIFESKEIEALKSNTSKLQKARSVIAPSRISAFTPTPTLSSSSRVEEENVGSASDNEALGTEKRVLRIRQKMQARPGRSSGASNSFVVTPIAPDLISFQYILTTNDKLLPVTSNDMWFPPKSSESVALDDTEVLYKSGGTIASVASAALTQIGSPRGERDFNLQANIGQLLTQLGSSQREEVVALSTEEVVASPSEEVVALSTEEVVASPRKSVSSTSEESEMEYKIGAKEEEKKMKSETNSQIPPYDVGHYNPETKLYSFKTLPRKLPNGSLANAERTVDLNQNQLDEILIKLSRHTDLCKQGKNYDLFFQLNDDNNSLTAIANESKENKRKNGETINNENAINFLFRDSVDDDLFSIPVPVVQKSYSGTYDSGTSMYRFNTIPSSGLTLQEVGFSELNFLLFLEINKDKFKGNGDFSVGVQIDDGKAVAIPFPHTKDGVQQPNSKYIHVGSEKIDLNQLPLLIQEADAKQSMIILEENARKNMIAGLQQGIFNPRLVNTLTRYPRFV